jgi:hypothetical protein
MLESDFLDTDALKMGKISEAEMKECLRAFLEDQDPILLKHKHQLRYLNSDRLARYLLKIRMQKQAAVVKIGE